MPPNRAFDSRVQTSRLGAYSPLVSEVTQILERVEQGDPKAAEELLPLVYEELRKLAAVKMAQERPGLTLQATALVHEAWLRLVGADDAKAWNSRSHFFGAAAEAMRRILVDRARQKARVRHGGGLEPGSASERSHHLVPGHHRGHVGVHPRPAWP